VTLDSQTTSNERALGERLLDNVVKRVLKPYLNLKKPAPTESRKNRALKPPAG
jgi:hypothetical protein